jgi:magnesium chelatase accessory protein
MSDSVASLLGALPFSPRYCVGHSAGAVVLCRMALDHRIEPRLIIAINGAFLPLGGAAGVLFSPLAKLLSKSAFLPRVVSRRAGNLESVARVLRGTGSKVDSQGLDLYARLVRNPQHVAGALAMMGGWDLRSFARDLPRLTVPLALMVGANDRTVPPSQAFEVQRLVPHAVVRTIAGLGHLAHEEQPASAADAILELCAAAPS